MSRPAYDELGVNYTDFRLADPCIEASPGGARRGPQRGQRRAGTGTYQQATSR